MNKISLLLVACLLVSGCTKKEILQGKREPINGITFTDLDITNTIINTNITNKLNSNVNIIWQTSLDKRPINSNLVVNNKYIYTISGNGTLYCLDVNTGKVIWKYQIINYVKSSFFSGHLIYNNGILYIGTNTNEVLAFDINHKKTLWKKSLDSSVKALISYHNSKLIVITNNNSTYVLDINTGNILFNLNLDRDDLTLTQIGTPVIYKDNIICVYSSGEVVSFNLTNNTTNWSNILIPLQPYNSGDSILHIAVSPIIIGNNVLVANANSIMTLLDANSGLKLWEKKLGCVTTPLVIDNKWIIALTNKHVVCLDVETGDIKWKTNLLQYFTQKIYKNTSWYGPLLINGQIYVFNAEADIAKIDINNGKIIDTQHTHHVLYTSTPYAFKKLLLVMSKNKIFALQ